MQKAYMVVLVAVLLLLPHQSDAWRRWNWNVRRWTWRDFGRVALAVAPAIAALVGRSASALDTNKDGVIDHEELARAVGERASMEELDTFMMIADTDGDGTVTRREVDTIFNKL